MRKGVKLCGAAMETDIRRAELGGAQAVGVIIRPNSTYDQRSVGSHSQNPRKARELREAARKSGLEFVAVMRTDQIDEIIEIADAVEPDRIQIGQVADPTVAFAVRSRYWGTGLRPEIAQVVHVDDATEPDIIDGFTPHVDYIHLDSPGPLPGGNGRTHDWSRSARIAKRAHGQSRSVILAGGLAVDNVAEAIRAVQPDGVDVETNIRSEHGVYNQKMIRDFVDAAV